MTAEAIAKALGGRKAGRDWMARCPAHDDRKPSLSIATGDEGRVLVCCHAGCPQAAVVAALKARGLWPGWAAARWCLQGREVRTARPPQELDFNNVLLGLPISRF